MPPKNRVTSRPVPDSRTLPLYDAISQQAKKLWERYGRPEDRDDQIWEEAERQVLGSAGGSNQPRGGAVPAAPMEDVHYPTGHGNFSAESASSDSDDEAGNGKLGAPGADTGLPK